ncbi:radical SAM superfamily enzyme YgiQ (UPF0313 family) [Orenia metallireducens]|uniref:Radical SAM superfamily enzyme YgiQ, UPF0313 family n=1 Tax=Orenia metallireducens TaxID=1413210 RepID=A0A285I1S2_9FIRM|nr:radical SAM protein [Orenia metallireducens]PRX23229.1 radical SAM superfamily enzyme YgiQ (UPF0313 family) [Orenia metallireducens]SNY41915.1 Radical SAM superfamily enzyme YgiQ, UPF0313 family [Orenia metallireducens]
MKKIALVVPRSYNPKRTYSEYPLGVGYIGTLLKDAGYEVRIFDQNLEFRNNKRLVEELDKYAPFLIGFSIITPTYPTAKEIIDLLKADGCESHLIAGGVHATLFPKDLVEDGFDIVMKGEGETIIVPLAKNLETGKSIIDFPGIVYRDNDRIMENNKKQILTDVNELPLIDRSIYNLDLYTHHSMVGSRGCPYKCKFCCNYSGVMLNKGFSVRCVENVIQEMIYINQHYGAKNIFFVDDIFLLKKSRILEFCNSIIEKDFNISWIGQMRVDTIDEEIAYKLKEANCEKIYFGVESGSNKILTNIGKRFNRNKIIQGIRYAKEAGLRVKTGWVYGLPGDLKEQYKSISLMLETKPNEISIHQLIPFPGTEYYNNPSKYGINIADPKDFKEFCYGGLNRNISFDYLSQSQYLKLLEDTIDSLNKAGYVSSDQSKGGSDYIYTTPLNKYSITEFDK